MYQIVLSLHLIFMVSWFAGLFYLPRLFIYHTENSTKKACHTMLMVMERKLFNIIMTPAMVLTWVFGLGLVHLNPHIAEGGWFHAKMGLVTVLTVYHFSLALFKNHFAEEKNTKTSKFFRFYNEVPTLILFGVVFLVVLKPF